ncbi:MAG: lipocalin-like domain-containing protein [Bacteroidaceae bacterium]|nr:lipocalin-like domain-containing protein [Bacteroidaceae bacterium]
MKRTLYIIVLYFATALFLFSCDGWKWDKDRDFYGMWQMTEWRDKSSGDVLKTQADGLYYCFQLGVMKFQNSNFIGSYYLSRYTHSHDSLRLDDIVEYPVDTIIQPTGLTEKFGTPANGRYHIDHLSDSHMILSTDESILTFRRY